MDYDKKIYMVTTMKIFIAGTDTDVGKTHVTAALCALLLQKGLHVGVIKWISTGAKGKSADIDCVIRWAERATMCRGSKLSVSCPCCLEFPASPHLSAAIEKKDINVHEIIERTKQLERQCDVVLVEGVGGLMVPINQETLLIDLMKEVNYPVVLVARTGLGTINHTLLSAEAISARDLELKAIVMNEIGFQGKRDETHKTIVADNLAIVGTLSKTRVYGPIPYGEDILSDKVQGILAPLVNVLEEGTS